MPFLNNTYTFIEASREYTTFCYYEGIFSARECRKIIATGFQPQMARMGEKSHIAFAANYPKQNPLYQNKATAWIYERIAPVIDECNSQVFRFHLAGFAEPLNINRFDVNQGYGWHNDLGDHVMTRKLAVVAFLSPEEDYRGGRLEFLTATKSKCPQSLGTVVIFPSFVPHRVTKVTQGRRHTMVGLIHGPSFI